MIHPIPPGYFCVPSALLAITGEDPASRVLPALNRASRGPTLTGAVAGVYPSAAEKALDELGYNVRRYKGDRPLKVQVRTWAKRFPDRIILVCTATHCLVLHEGRIYDNWLPHGPGADEDHPFARTLVTWAALVEKRSS